ncbi:hypothetical protein ABPG77_004979, partial [Micractinium sp. CCAP 211/92]
FPTIHDLRMLNMVCTICTCGFAITATALSLYNGFNPPPDTPPVSYSVLGSPTYITLASSPPWAPLPSAFGDTILPEATLGEPVKRNAYKAVALCYSVISIGYLLVTITGYWIIGCYQIYCRPTYEVVEVWAMDTKQSPTALRNIIGRFVVTTIYCSLLTLLGCALPFFAPSWHW